MKYSFYSKNDSKKEIINVCDSDSLENATIKFASSKQLEKEIFLELFEVIKG